MLDKKLVKTSFFQALGITSYIMLIALFFWKANTIFGEKDPTYFAPVILLLMFSVSVLVCGLIMFYQPFLLWDKGKSKDAVKLVVYSLGWLIVALLVVSISVATFSN